jgi:predicted CXXCH cytochrome family protein
MPTPGMRRSEYLLAHTSRIDAPPSSLHASGDSKSHHQQYTDFIRTGKYRNGAILMTCESCHNPHGGEANQDELRFGRDDNGFCLGCHTGQVDLRAHVTAETGFAHEAVDVSAFRCVDCHMVGTAASGARRPGLLDDLPVGGTSVWHFQGDIASHRFAVPLQDVALVQPSASTLACGTCHEAYLLNP